MAKNDQNLAILCNKVENLQATTLLFDTLRLFDTKEYEEILQFAIHFREWARRLKTTYFDSSYRRLAPKGIFNGLSKKLIS